MRKWLRSIGGTRSYEGREFPVDTWVELESEFQPQFMVNSDVRADIEAEAIEISVDVGGDYIHNKPRSAERRTQDAARPST